MKITTILMTLAIVLLAPTSSWARKDLPEGVLKQLLVVLEANENLHASFFTYDGKKIKENALKLKSKLEVINSEDINPMSRIILEELNKLNAEQDRKLNDQIYHKISLQFVKILQRFNTGSTYNIYYCPMIDMRWIQNSVKQLKVHNPFAPEMPHCGARETQY